MRTLARARGCVAATILGLNTLAIVVVMVPIGLAKLALPFPGARRLTNRLLNALARVWVVANRAWVRGGRRTHWDISGAQGLDPRAWYLVTCNHRSWADIFVLQEALSGRVPVLKFFLKRSLAYVPVIGFAWWVLDFPFVSRKGGASAAKRDLAATRDSCRRFLAEPTALLNFLEGTRFTPEKATAQGSPYRHLLKPRAAGLATALSIMGAKVDTLVDVTLVYPRVAPTFWGLLCGELEEVVVHVRQLEWRQRLGAAGMTLDPKARQRVQQWLQDLWSEKDLEIDAFLRAPAPARAV